jgi:1,4-alpha-glucan branching enzyme
MHRSGTSMLSQIMHRSGIFMGSDFKAYYESNYFQKLNEQLLNPYRPVSYHNLINRHFLPNTCRFTGGPNISYPYFCKKDGGGKIPGTPIP